MRAGWRPAIAYRSALACRPATKLAPVPGRPQAATVAAHSASASLDIRRCQSSSSTAPPTLPPASNDLRRLMRKVAQPVAVITANLKDASSIHEPDHGGTVSSFVSISMSPAPLVAFALRLPSRLASFLNSGAARTAASGNAADPTIKIHLLTSSHEHLARAFARPPPSTAKQSASGPTFAPFPRQLFDELDESALGTLECSIVGSVHLDDPLPAHIGTRFRTEVSDPQASAKLSSADPSQATSQLFIAKVARVTVRDEEQDPLLYCHQGYYSLKEKA